MSTLFNLIPSISAPPPNKLTDKEYKYFDKLCDSLICYPDSLSFNGRIKALYQNNPYTTIMTEGRWTSQKKNLFEAYIFLKYQTPDKFNDWVLKTRRQEYAVRPKFTFLNEPRFNLVFCIADKSYLECYIRDTMSNGQVRLYNISQKNPSFYNEIVNYLRDIRHLKSISIFSDQTVIKALRHDINNGNFIYKGKIKLISNSPRDLCLAYIQLDPMRVGNFPTWQNFINKIKTFREQKLFMAWIYGIFVENDINRQILWLEGEGYCGKSTVFNAIGEILIDYNRSLFRSIPPEQHFNSHSLEDFDKCRLAVFPNADERSFFKRVEILNMTGGDFVTINAKNKAAKTEKLYVKIAAHSNYPPEIDKNAMHETTRLLHIRIDSSKIDKDKFKNSFEFASNLKKEFMYFLEYCQKHYKECIRPNGLLQWNKYDE